MKHELIYLAVFLVIVLLFVFYFMSAKGDKKKIVLINSKGSEITVDAEIADNMTTRAKGLMGRKSLGEYEGMLFVFDRPGTYSFWMLNTTIPLDAIFIDGNGDVVEIIQMEPCGFNVLNCSANNYKSKEQAQYVLEVNQGFADEHSIIPGKSSALIEAVK